MSELVIFIIGAVVFAITVYGTVMAGGIGLNRLAEREESLPARTEDGRSSVADRSR